MLDYSRAEWPESAERTYSIHDKPNTCLVAARIVYYVTTAVMMLVVAHAYFTTGGH